MAVTDAELIGRFRRGDPDAFARLATRWEGKAYAIAYRLTLDPDESEDIRQTALLRAHEALGTFQDRASFSTWLYRVVLNLCRDRLRSRQARARALRRGAAARGTAERVAETPGVTSEQAELSRRVAEAVASLPQGMREVVIMRHYEDLSFARIAEILKAPVSTVKSRMAQGLRLLRAQLEDLAR